MSDLNPLNEQLIEASRRGDSEAVKVLIPQTDPTFNDSIALRAAAQRGHAECIRLLIPVSDPKSNDSLALRWASSNGHVDCVRLLIPVSDPKESNSLALRSAALKGHADCVALLLPVSDPLSVGLDGLTPGDWARRQGHPDVAGMIDAFIEAQDLTNSLSPRHAKPALRAAL
jgi:ankyrin repeat protein